jgi:selenocysteine-specific elongation factor
MVLARHTDFKSVVLVCKTGRRFDSPCPLHQLCEPTIMEKYITIGIAGHVDHGKTSLVRTLTGIETDRLEEEKRRGLSIESGVAPFQCTSGLSIALVDVPGHTDFLKNTIRGLSCVDMAILVVAPDDGVMPQTREHLEILDLFGAKTGFAVLSKADMVDRETLELAELEIREVVRGTVFQGKPVIPFSALDREGLDDIRSAIELEASHLDSKFVDDPFRLWIDQVSGVAGFGTVVTGTIFSGTLSQNDSLVLWPSGIETRARSLETHHKLIEKAYAGQRVGLNLHRVPMEQVGRGMLLAAPGLVNPSFLLNVDLKVLKTAKTPIRNRQRVKLYLGTSVTNTLVVLMDDESLQPGQHGLAQLRLMKPVAAMPREPFVICPLNLNTVMGGGKVLEIPCEKFRVVKAERTLPYLSALKSCDLPNCVQQFFDAHTDQFLVAAELARTSGFSIDETTALLKEKERAGEVLTFRDKGFFSKKRYDQLKKALPGILQDVLSRDAMKRNVKAEELRRQLSPHLEEEPFQRMLSDLCRDGKLVKIDGGFRVSGVSVNLSPQQARLAALCMSYAQGCGFAPFSADTVWKLPGMKYEKQDIEKMLSYLRNEGKLLRLKDGRYIPADCLEAIKEKVRGVVAANGVFTLDDLRTTLGYGRRIGVIVLEYLDAIGFTSRRGEGRVLRETIAQSQ